VSPPEKRPVICAREYEPNPNRFTVLEKCLRGMRRIVHLFRTRKSDVGMRVFRVYADAPRIPLAHSFAAFRFECPEAGGSWLSTSRM